LFREKGKGDKIGDNRNQKDMEKKSSGNLELFKIFEQEFLLKKLLS